MYEDIKSNYFSLGEGTTKREPVATEICKRGSILVKRAENLTKSLGAKLGPVTSAPGLMSGCTPIPEAQEYPPLFSELRSQFRSLEASLDIIDEILSRVEL